MPERGRCRRGLSSSRERRSRSRPRPPRRGLISASSHSSSRESFSRAMSIGMNFSSIRTPDVHPERDRLGRSRREPFHGHRLDHLPLHRLDVDPAHPRAYDNEAPASPVEGDGEVHLLAAKGAEAFSIRERAEASRPPMRSSMILAASFRASSASCSHHHHCPPALPRPPRQDLSLPHGRGAPRPRRPRQPPSGCAPLPRQGAGMPLLPEQFLALVLEEPHARSGRPILHKLSGMRAPGRGGRRFH